uniref:Uncharacterized protein n=1 Tax=Trichinella nativa TaxID=6335 RepID=A0A0V1JTM6_9BILA
MAIKLKIMENEKHKLTGSVVRQLKIMENEKHTL